MRSLNSMFDGFLSRAGIRQQVVAASVVSAANDFIRARLPEAAWAMAEATVYQQGVLHVRCSSAAVAHEINGLFPELAAAVERAVPHASVDRLAVRHDIMRS